VNVPGLPSGLWAIAQSRLGRYAAHGGSAGDSAREPQVIRGVGIVHVSGLLLKGWPLDGYLARDMGALAGELMDMAADRTVRRIFLSCDSPGGTVAGMPSLIEAVRAVADSKPVHAHIDDLGASAAYWLASQAHTISASPLSEVGSVGALVAVDDSTAAYAKAGITRHVVRSGARKAPIVDGTPVTQDALDELKLRINEAAAAFRSDVNAGRLDRFRAGAIAATHDARLVSAREAERIGFIDKIATQAQALGAEIEAAQVRRAR